MILRRLATSIRKQDWFTVGVETLIVVFGVFIGLQVNNWNADREARSGELRYLERLRDDVAGSIEQNEWRLSFMERQDRYSTLALERLETCTVPPEDRNAFANALYHVGKSLPPVLTRGVINELNATGNFQIIQNEKLRGEITKATETIETSDQIFYAILMRGTPHVAYVESELEHRNSGPRSGAEDIVWGDISFDLEALWGDQRFRSALSLSRAYVNDMASSAIRARDQQRNLLAMIDAELEK
jgi:hypothetical protein